MTCCKAKTKAKDLAFKAKNLTFKPNTKSNIIGGQRLKQGKSLLFP